ncbi:MAG: DUF1858 domain-containing protein [Bacteroidales bacterium]|nr:DUF1858 domain-containing protein [Bacteroidales bacterium]
MMTKLKDNQFSITPKTKIADLLIAYPEVENLLIEMAPAFAKLKNPVLMKTIARVTTLQQAALIGKVAVGEMVNKIRNFVGQSGLDIAEPGQENSEKPNWFDPDNIETTLDGRPILAKGEHPLGQVFQDLLKLPEGKTYLLITPFLPAPLVEKIQEKGYNTWTDEKDGLFNTYIIHLSLTNGRTN